MQGGKEGVEGSRGGLAQMGLEFGEGHLDRVQVRGVVRQEEHPRATRPDGGFGLCALMDAEVVKDDDIAGFERGRQSGLDIDVGGGAVHGAVDHPGRCQALVAQAGDQGLRTHFPKGALALRRCPRERGRAGGSSWCRCSSHQ